MASHELKSAELEAEMNQCTETGTVGHLSDLSKTGGCAPARRALLLLLLLLVLPPPLLLLLLLLNHSPAALPAPSAPDLGGAKKVAMFIDESKPTSAEASGGAAEPEVCCAMLRLAWRRQHHCVAFR